MRMDQQPDRDIRTVVLLLLAALMLAAGWLTSALPDRQTSFYFWKDGRLIRSKGRAEKGILLAVGTVCTDIPPELAAFFHLPLPVSRADQAALVRLPGIGPKLAEKIIRFRERNGIAGPDDLLKVKGIGPKRSARLLPFLCFDNAL